MSILGFSQPNTTTHVSPCVADNMEVTQTPDAHIVMGVSDTCLEQHFAMSRAEAVRRIRIAIEETPADSTEIQITFDDAVNTERPFLFRCIETAIEAGATHVRIVDVKKASSCEGFHRMMHEIRSRIDGRVHLRAVQ